MRAHGLTSKLLVSLAVLSGSLALFAAPALAAAPSVTVNAPTGVTGTTVHVSGTVNPNGAPGTTPTFWGIQYARASEPGAWVGTTIGGEFKEAEAELKTPQPVGGVIEGLEPSMAYEVRVVAVKITVNEVVEEASPEPEEPFTTLAIPPGLLSETATPSTPFEARLEGVINPNNQVTSCEFQYGMTTAFATHVACEPPSLGGFSGQGVGLTLTGLESGKTYHSRIVLENAKSEITTGTDVPFNTPPAEAPIVDSEAVTEATLTSTDASLEAKINPNYQQTTYGFEYATSPAALGTAQAIKVTPTPPSAALPAVFEEQLAGPVDLGNALTPGQIYYYRVLATNNAGTTEGTTEVHSFQTLDVPVPSTGEAREVTDGSAALTGAVNPAGAPTRYYFSYIDQAGYQAALAEGAADPYAKGAGTPEVTTEGDYSTQPIIPLTAGGLLPDTTYHYALVASNTVGTVTGSDETFTTGATTPPPVALTGEAINIASGTATLTATVDTQGAATATSFEFGNAPYSGTFEGSTAIPASGAPTGVSYTFNGYLLPATTYYYRIIATSENGTTYGNERSFTTAAPPSALTSPVTQLLTIPSETKPAPAKPTAPKTLTKKQKLNKALNACHTKRDKQRSKCEGAARRKYGAVKGKRK